MPSLTGGLCLRALLLGCLTPSLSKFCRYLRSLHDSCCMPVGLPLKPDIVAAANPGHSTLPPVHQQLRTPSPAPPPTCLYAYPVPLTPEPIHPVLHWSLPPCQSRPRRGTAQHLTVPPSACSVEMWGSEAARRPPPAGQRPGALPWGRRPTGGPSLALTLCTTLYPGRKARFCAQVGITQPTLALSPAPKLTCGAAGALTYNFTRIHPAQRTTT